MCWVQRKPFAGPPSEKNVAKGLQNRAGQLEELIRAKEKELELLTEQLQMVDKAISERMVGEEATVAEIPEIPASSEITAEEETDTDHYLRTRMADQQLKAEIGDAEDARIDAMMQGVVLTLYTVGKGGGPFGRKKVTKTETVTMWLSEDEESISWGSSKESNKNVTTIPIEKCVVVYGKTSEFFRSGVETPPWDCFTVHVEGHEHNFSSSERTPVLVACTVIDALGGASEGQPRLTRARFLWIRSFHRAEYRTNRLANLIAEGGQAEGGQAEGEE